MRKKCMLMVLIVSIMTVSLLFPAFSDMSFGAPVPSPSYGIGTVVWPRYTLKFEPNIVHVGDRLHITLRLYDYATHRYVEGDAIKSFAAGGLTLLIDEGVLQGADGRRIDDLQWILSPDHKRFELAVKEEREASTSPADEKTMFTVVQEGRIAAYFTESPYAQTVAPAILPFSLEDGALVPAPAASHGSQSIPTSKHDGPLLASATNDVVLTIPKPIFWDDIHPENTPFSTVINFNPRLVIYEDGRPYAVDTLKPRMQIMTDDVKNNDATIDDTTIDGIQKENTHASYLLTLPPLRPQHTYTFELLGTYGDAKGRMHYRQWLYELAIEPLSAIIRAPTDGLLSAGIKDRVVIALPDRTTVPYTAEQPRPAMVRFRVQNDELNDLSRRAILQRGTNVLPWDRWIPLNDLLDDDITFSFEVNLPPGASLAIDLIWVDRDWVDDESNDTLTVDRQQLKQPADRANVIGYTTIVTLKALPGTLDITPQTIFAGRTYPLTITIRDIHGRSVPGAQVSFNVPLVMLGIPQAFGFYPIPSAPSASIAGRAATNDPSSVSDILLDGSLTTAPVTDDFGTLRVHAYLPFPATVTVKSSVPTVPAERTIDVRKLLKPSLRWMLTLNTPYMTVVRTDEEDNKQKHVLELPFYMYSERGRALLPLKVITDALGDRLSYEPRTKHITWWHGDKRYTFALGSDTVTIEHTVYNKKVVYRHTMPLAARTYDALRRDTGRILVPIYTLAELLNGELQYDKTTQTICFTVQR